MVHTFFIRHCLVNQNRMHRSFVINVNAYKVVVGLAVHITVTIYPCKINWLQFVSFIVVVFVVSMKMIHQQELLKNFFTTFLFCLWYFIYNFFLKNYSAFAVYYFTDRRNASDYVVFIVRYIASMCVFYISQNYLHFFMNCFYFHCCFLSLVVNAMRYETQKHNKKVSCNYPLKKSRKQQLNDNCRKRHSKDYFNNRKLSENETCIVFTTDFAKHEPKIIQTIMNIVMKRFHI